MLFELKDKTIIVTGGAGGIGEQYSRALASAGARVVVVDLDAENGLSLSEELKGQVEFFKADVLDQDAIDKVIRDVVETHGKIDVLINNVGVYPHHSFEEITLEVWQKVLRTNLDSMFICTKSVYRVMKRQGYGKIINIATNLVWMMVPDMAHYITSKAGIVGFTQSVAHEFGRYGITVNALAPGANMPIEEKLSEQDIQRMRMIVGFQAIKRPQVKGDLTGAMLFLCSEHSDFMTGQTICIDGGLAVH